MRIAIVLFVSALTFPAAAARCQSPQELFQRALTLERSQGKLDSAIVLYRRAIAAAGTNRALAARALMRMGSAYEVLGRTEARAAYERVVRDFGDQSELAGQARQRLVALNGPAGTSSATGRPTAREVWSGDNVNVFAAPSPNGRYATYLAESGDLAIHDLVTGRDRVLPTRARLFDKDGTRNASGGYADLETVFSPDSRRVAYAWHTDQEGSYELRTIGVDGAEPKTVPIPKMRYVESFAWTATGDGILASIYDRSGSDYLAIVRMTGQIERIAAIGKDWWNFGLSPDGRWMTYDALVPGAAQRDVYIMGVDGAHRGALVRTAANDWHPMWAPDGRSVLFYSDRSGGWRVWQQDIVDGVARGEPRVLTADMGRTLAIGLTNDGALWYSPSSMAPGIEIAEVDSLTGRVTQAPTEFGDAFNGVKQTPEWSPDGASLVFVSLRSSMSGRPDVLMIVSRDGATQREISVPLRQFHRPRWSPDGRTILLAGIEADSGRVGVFGVDVATGALSRIRLMDHGVRGVRGEWSADGRSVYYMVVDSTANATLHRFDVDARRDTTVYRDTTTKGFVDFTASPDGQWVALTMNDGRGPRTSQLLSLRDGTRRDITPLRWYSNMSWTPDSRALVGVSSATAKPGDAELWRAPIDGGAASRIELGMRGITYARVDRSGRRIVFVGQPTTQTGTQLWVMEHLLAPRPKSR